MVQIEGPDTTQNFAIISQYKKVCDLRHSTEYSISVSAMTMAGSGPAISVSFVMPQGGKASECIYWHHYM